MTLTWTRTADEMPKSGRRVLFAWKNQLGKTRVGAGSWVAANTEEAYGEQLEEDCTYDEATDTYYMPEGWREWGWELEFTAEPDGPVTHWMPIPLHPDRKGELTDLVDNPKEDQE